MLLHGWLSTLALSSTAALTFLVNGLPSALVIAPFSVIRFQHSLCMCPFFLQYRQVTSALLFDKFVLPNE